MARKRKSGPVVLEPTQVPPHLTRCKVCEQTAWAYATADSKTPPWYICKPCYESMMRDGN